LNQTEESLVTIRGVVERHVGKKHRVEDDTPLVSGGLIDSMSIIDLIQDLEAALTVKIPISEVQPDDFDSVQQISATVARFR
jgi:acyl carrier protein